MTEQWQELKETIIELRDSNGTLTQQEVCKFLTNHMEVLEKQMQQPKTNTWSIIKDVVDTSAKHGLTVEQQPCEEQQTDNECANIIDVRNYLWSKINLLRDEFGEDIYFDMFWEIARGIYNDVPHVVPKLNVDNTLKDIFRECGQAYMLGYEDASKKFRTNLGQEAVSREAVETFKEALIDKLAYTGYTEEYKDEIIDIINQMPSVTPSYNSIKTELKPCEDCVSREAVSVLVDELARAISDERIGISRGRSTATIMRDILHLSSVTPQRPKGKWMECGGDEPWLKGYCCSLCNFTTTQKYDYCTCGAEMETNKE